MSWHVLCASGLSKQIIEQQKKIVMKTLYACVGMHAEGGIWSTLFGLLMWDVLFMSVPDIFRTSFQTAPLDLSSPSFYPARKMAIDDQLKLIR